MNKPPAVSVIISAYNRPTIVQYAMRSVLASDFDDFELIVVGDGCNAETEAAILEIEDPRIRFENLPRNTGHQSAPHNRGMQLARGEYIFFLNQDDMYFPDHIGNRVRFMQENGADLCWSTVILLRRSGRRSGFPDPGVDSLTTDGAVPFEKFDPRSFIISSCWSVRREVCQSVGDWLEPSQTYLSPSQEWLFRAWRQGTKMVHHPCLSVLCIHSGARRYSYVDRRNFEHQRAWSWLQAGEPARLKILECITVRQAARIAFLRNRVYRLERPAFWWLTKRLMARGYHPDAVMRMLKGVGKGGWVRAHTRFTREPPRLRPGAVIKMGDASAEGHLGDGWGRPKGAGRPAIGEAAQVFFLLDKNDFADGGMKIELCLSGAPVALRASVNQSAGIETLLEDGQNILELRVDEPGAHYIELSVVQDEKPREDAGYVLEWLRAVPVTSNSRSQEEKCA